MGPEVGDHISAVGPVEGLAQAGLVAEVCLDDLNSMGGELTRLLGVGVARQRPRSERTRRVGEDRPDQAPSCAPVAPTTAMIFFPAIVYVL